MFAPQTLIKLVQTVGGVQFDIFPSYSPTVKFSSMGGEILNMYKSPRQLGIYPGQSLIMRDWYEQTFLSLNSGLAILIVIHYINPNFLGIQKVLYYSARP